VGGGRERQEQRKVNRGHARASAASGTTKCKRANVIRMSDPCHLGAIGDYPAERHPSTFIGKGRMMKATPISAILVVSMVLGIVGWAAPQPGDAAVGGVAVLANGLPSGQSIVATNPDVLVGTAADETNILVGLGAGEFITTGNYNTFLGYFAGHQNTIGVDNTFSGCRAGCDNLTGNCNTFLGCDAGHDNTKGSGNTFLGYEAGAYNLEGWGNTFSGTQTGYHNTKGEGNTFSGSAAGYSNTEGMDNTFSGTTAGYHNTTGATNTFLGAYAGYSNVLGGGNVFLGYEAGFQETGSNRLYIANSKDTPLIYGDFATRQVGIGTTASEVPGDVTLHVNGGIRWFGRYTLDFTNNVIDQGYIQIRSGHNNELYGISTWLSSAKAKKNIADLETDTSKIYDLRPVSFNWRAEKDGKPKSIGMIAEEVDKVLPQIVRYDEEGKPHHVSYELLSVLLLKEMQKLHDTLVVANDGSMGVGTASPQCALDIRGEVQAKTYLAGDIVFQKEGKKLWRLFEDEDGLYVEKIDTRRVYALIPKDTSEAMETTGQGDLAGAVERLRRENESLRERVKASETVNQSLTKRIDALEQCLQRLSHR
jgi:hypothetical protein